MYQLFVHQGYRVLTQGFHPQPNGTRRCPQKGRPASASTCGNGKPMPADMPHITNSPSKKRKKEKNTQETWNTEKHATTCVNAHTDTPTHQHRSTCQHANTPTCQHANPLARQPSLGPPVERLESGHQLFVLSILVGCYPPNQRRNGEKPNKNGVEKAHQSPIAGPTFQAPAKFATISCASGTQ